MVKIISGWSDRGGSTFAFINLTNKLNESGIDTTFYGPHPWHLDKCKSGLLDEKFRLYENDIVITHFLNLGDRPNVKKIILSCHEKNLFEVGKIKKYWDTIVFVNNKQRKYHNEYNGPFEIIPNIKEVLEKKEKDESVKNVAGIVGSIDENKQTHISIERAIEDGMEKIYLFGNISDQNYYEKKVKPLIDNDRVVEYGFVSDKQKIYDMINYAYLSSKSEVASLVKDECESTGTIFKGNFATNNDSESITNSEIIEKWIKLLMN
jgi:glycosyltransferase involved in cell wall biosynthesis